MSHSLTKVWVHLILGVKNRQNLLQKEAFEITKKFLIQNLEEMGCGVRIINGIENHLHLLFLLPPTKSLSEVVKQIKGSSSHHLNSQDLLPTKFSWQTGYGAFSVSESNVSAVAEYIKNQKIHHQKLTFEQEYQLFVQKHWPDGVK